MIDIPTLILQPCYHGFDIPTKLINSLSK